MSTKKKQSEKIEKEETLNKEEIKELVTQTVEEVLEEKKSTEEPAEVEKENIPEKESEESKPQEQKAPIVTPSTEQPATPEQESQPQQQESASPTSPPPPNANEFSLEESRSKKPLIIGIIIVVILLIVGGVLFSRFNVGTLLQEEEIIPSPSPLPSATPTPQEEVDVESYSIKILNGSGIAGAASQAEERLSDASFSVEEIGNAQTSDYTKTIIAAQESVPEAFLTKLTETLEQYYAVSTTVENISDSDEVDVVITIGRTANE